MRGIWYALDDRGIILDWDVDYYVLLERCYRCGWVAARMVASNVQQRKGMYFKDE